MRKAQSALRGTGVVGEVVVADNGVHGLEAVARESIARYNRFLEEASGYTAKERARRLRKTAGE